MGPLFTDHDLMRDPSLPDVCDGCARMLGGKPSREDPPLRMGHFAVIGGDLHQPDGEALVGLLRCPPTSITALGWTSSRQKHASLHAGLCGPAELHVGTEAGVVVWLPEHVEVMDAVSGLRAHARREHVLSGDYPPASIVALGASWGPLEAVVAAHRPSILLDMLCAIVRRPEITPETATMPIATEQRTAADLLLRLAVASSERRSDPIRFWAELLPRRVAAAVSRPSLLAAVADLMQRISVNPLSTEATEAVATIEAMTDAEAATVLRLWRDQPLLVIAISRLIRQEDY